MNSLQRKLRLGGHALRESRRYRQHAVRGVPCALLHPPLAPAKLQGAVLSVNDDRHPGEARRDQSLNQRAPGVGMHHIRPFAPKQLVQIPDQPWVVTVATTKLEE